MNKFIKTKKIFLKMFLFNFCFFLTSCGNKQDISLQLDFNTKFSSNDLLNTKKTLNNKI